MRSLQYKKKKNVLRRLIWRLKIIKDLKPILKIDGTRELLLFELLAKMLPNLVQKKVKKASQDNFS